MQILRPGGGNEYTYIIGDCEVLCYEKDLTMNSKFLDPEKPEWGVKTLVAFLSHRSIRPLENTLVSSCMSSHLFIS